MVKMWRVISTVIFTFSQLTSFVMGGHIHKTDIKTIEGVEYMNTGDWVESCTALVETLDGEWKIIKYGN